MSVKPVKVSQLNAYIRRIVQSNPVLGNVTVTGEVSNLKFHSTGHVYFTLKDETSRISCFMPSDVVSQTQAPLTEGMEAVICGYINIYERGGTYSLNVRTIESAGAGSLAVQFEKLKKQLEEEGLFDSSKKKPLKMFPEKVAVVTSDTGAAVRDIIKIIRSRNSFVDIIVCPVLVQGPSAAADISSMIDSINENRPDIDVIITGRGGGSIEELWAFNEEIVARSIYASKIPVISAVGHETDTTIADYVADVRAETPTAAAALAVPDISGLIMYTDDLSDEMTARMESVIQTYSYRLAGCSMESLMHFLESMIERKTTDTIKYRNIIDFEADSKLLSYENRIDKAGGILDSLNHTRILEKGYSMILNESGGLVTSADMIENDEDIRIVMNKGTADARVTKVVRSK